MKTIFLIVIILPLATAALVTCCSSKRAARLGVSGAGLTCLVAIGLLAGVILSEPVSLAIFDNKNVPSSWRADQLSVLLFVLIYGVSFVVQAFARRYLQGDIQVKKFFVFSNLFVGSTGAMVGSATLIGLAFAWTAASFALCKLLGMYQNFPAAKEGVRRSVWAFAVSDGALWTAVILATLQWGVVDIHKLNINPTAFVAGEPVTFLVACFLLIAALGRSAQIPLHNWLPATLAAPTPVSALLHAGGVNAGGILLVKAAPLFLSSAFATHLAFALGALTMIYGTVLMLVKPDIKGSLVYSTIGQMGFMIMTCGLGAFSAAVFHLVAHGMYKARLFLGSGTAVHSYVDFKKRPIPQPVTSAVQTAKITLAVCLPLISLLIAVFVLDYPLANGNEALLFFIWATSSWALFGLLRQKSSFFMIATLLFVGPLVTVGYLAASEATATFLKPALPAQATTAVSIWLIVPVFLLLGWVSFLIALPTSSRLSRLRMKLYPLVLTASSIRVKSNKKMENIDPAFPSCSKIVLLCIKESNNE